MLRVNISTRLVTAYIRGAGKKTEGQYPSEYEGIVQPTMASCSVSRRFLAYQSSRAGPVLFWEVWEEQERSRECGCTRRGFTLL